MTLRELINGRHFKCNNSFTKEFEDSMTMPKNDVRGKRYNQLQANGVFGNVQIQVNGMLV